MRSTTLESTTIVDVLSLQELPSGDADATAAEGREDYPLSMISGFVACDPHRKVEELT